MQNPVFEYYNNTVLCVNQDVFIDLNLLSYDQFQKWCQREKIQRVRTAGNGRTGLIRWDSIPTEELDKIKAAYGDPYRRDDVQSFLSKMEPDEKAAAFFQRAHLDPKKELRYYTEAQILNTYGKLLVEIEAKARRNPGFKKTRAKRELSKIINELKTVRFPNTNKQKYPHKLPTNPKALERRYKEYQAEGYERLIHKGGGNSNSKKIKGDIAKWILANYCLPNKPTTVEIHKEYMKLRSSKKWPSLTESAINQWLQQTEQRIVWVLARHGRATWINEFGHKVSRDKSDWFPNCYLAIDGSKLDWIHFKESSQNKMGADLKIDVVFDVYSEKILGYYCGTDHENYTQHFSAFKMALSESMSKPALITYDGQGGHRTEPMQELYDRVVTSNGGEHYKHRANEHGSPAEGLFSRFQQQVLNKVWWSDKQAVNVRKDDSKLNPDFIKRFQHKLKTVDACIDSVDYYVQKWNNQEHPLFKGQTRNEVYGHEETYPLEKLTELDMMNLFWITSKDPLTYTNTGITPTIRNEKYHFEVYDADGNVDIEFRNQYTGCKFYYQYDPNQLDNYIRLHLALPNGETKHVADAQPIKKVRSIPVLMNEHDKNRKHKMLAVRDVQLKEIEERLEALRHQTNITEESLIEAHELELKFKGNVPKEQRSLAEAGPGSWVNKL